ncbi:hypothetical protein BJ684DRAFT_15195 [Piptocephalis cylindrospora]|uniref:Uncharacterized protein n=1 Tax=Piptocephalis cylindrospora TaxID=1907219 RepID=A0A4P9Y601_9FUNG|nr:hypothetical protein BJ684DRAFT_15195 [Piptocephalis cylindrospora]|eukprot:RKP14486.1 hypothetical protein BJ684DRAFT_15195 [Piptocephalis cylindrospora]
MERLLAMAGPGTLAPPPFPLTTPSPPPATSPGQKLSTILETSETSRLTGASRLLRQTSRAVSNGSDWPGFHPGLGRSFTFQGDDLSGPTTPTRDGRLQEMDGSHDASDASHDDYLLEYKTPSRLPLRSSSSSNHNNNANVPVQDRARGSGSVFEPWNSAQKTPRKARTFRDRWLHAHSEDSGDEEMETRETATAPPRLDERHRTPRNLRSTRADITPVFTRANTDPEAIGPLNRAQPPPPGTPYWTPMGGTEAGSKPKEEKEEGRGGWLDQSQSPSIFRHRRNSLGSFGASTDSEEGDDMFKEGKEEWEEGEVFKKRMDEWEGGNAVPRGKVDGSKGGDHVKESTAHDGSEISDAAIPAPSALSASSMYFPQDKWSDDEEEVEDRLKSSSHPGSPTSRQYDGSNETPFLLLSPLPHPVNISEILSPIFRRRPSDLSVSRHEDESILADLPEQLQGRRERVNGISSPGWYFSRRSGPMGTLEGLGPEEERPVFSINGFDEISGIARGEGDERGEFSPARPIPLLDPGRPKSPGMSLHSGSTASTNPLTTPSVEALAKDVPRGMMGSELDGGFRGEGEMESGIEVFNSSFYLAKAAPMLLETKEDGEEEGFRASHPPRSRREYGGGTSHVSSLGSSSLFLGATGLDDTRGMREILNGRRKSAELTASSRMMGSEMTGMDQSSGWLVQEWARRPLAAAGHSPSEILSNTEGFSSADGLSHVEGPFHDGTSFSPPFTSTPAPKTKMGGGVREGTSTMTLDPRLRLSTHTVRMLYVAPKPTGSSREDPPLAQAVVGLTNKSEDWVPWELSWPGFRFDVTPVFGVLGPGEGLSLCLSVRSQHIPRSLGGGLSAGKVMVCGEGGGFDVMRVYVGAAAGQALSGLSSPSPVPEMSDVSGRKRGRGLGGGEEEDGLGQERKRTSIGLMRKWVYGRGWIDERERRPPSPTQDESRSSKKEEVSSRGVRQRLHVMEESLQGGECSLGQRTMRHVRVCNLTQEIMQVGARVEGPGFGLITSRVMVKPRCYVLLPIIWAPRRQGPTDGQLWLHEVSRPPAGSDPASTSIPLYGNGV